MAGEHGSIWAANNNYSLFQIQNGRVLGDVSSHFAARGPVEADRLYRDPRGVVCMAGLHDFMRFRSGRLERIDYPTQRGATLVNPTGHPITMAGDKSGRLWVSFRDIGVFRLEDRRWKSLESLGGPKGVALSAFTDSDGKVWLGFIDKTLALIAQDKVQIFSGKDGIRIGKIRTIHGRTAKVWIGGDAGVALFDGVLFHTMVPSDRTAFADVFGIVETAHNGLWFSEHNGVIHISEAEMLEFGKNPSHRVSYQVFGLLDGIPARLQKSTAVPSVVEGSDGLLWFATTHGIVWIDPKRVSQNTVAPLVSIQSTVADSKSYMPYTTLTLPAGTASLKIGYTGLSFAIPERVQFRYKMEGLENVWQEAGTRREAFYTNPGPGSYRFHVLASNDSGVWNETGAVLDLVVQAAFYQTLWFRSLCAMAAVGLIWSLYLFRLKQATAQIRVRLGERLVERERIARELHDTLLQGFNGLVLHFEAVMKQVTGNEPAQQMMKKALERADQVLLEARLRVRDLRSETTDANELAESLRSCGEEFSHHGAVSFRVEVVGTPRPLDPIAYDEAYRIGREAILNAFQHSLGSKIEAEITYDRDSLRLTIRDDGCGIEPGILSDGRAGHWGLSGLRERAENINGHLRIVSQPEAGTEVDLVVPASVAYPKDSPKLSVPWFKRVMRRGLPAK
jgi:signal transduction histidine kinase